jgi:tRNA dimethylallyltransferase
MLNQQIPVICLMGPTAAGKTDVAIELVRHLPCDIISVDSAMVYRGMDIGTAKPEPSQLAVAPHQLIDIRDPSEPYSAADFCRDAETAIHHSISHGRIPLLVGGTMLYFRALQQGLSSLPSAHPELRKTLELEAESIGWQALHSRLQRLDPEAAKRIHANDTQRIQRALEIIQLTGQPVTALYAQTQAIKNAYSFVNIALAPTDRTELHQRIASRFNKMLQQGFLLEVETLQNRGDLSPELPSMRAVGYRQAWEHVAGLISFQEMQERGIIATRQLAKRQLTWLRQWSKTTWFNTEDPAVSRKVLAILANQVML